MHDMIRSSENECSVSEKGGGGFPRDGQNTPDARRLVRYLRECLGLKMP